MNDTLRDFADIAPFDDSELEDKMTALVKEPGFEHAVKWVFPDIDFPRFVKKLLSIRTKQEFQKVIMAPFLENLALKTTAGITFEGLEKDKENENYVFMSNHRDIVLDAAFLNVGFLRQGRKTSEVAIGDNLLIYEWIADLVKLNGSFIVKRNTHPAKALENARHLSAYIHFAIKQKHESVWIAQREGRAKDSNDMTQESLVKMLSLGGPDGIRENLRSLNIFPVSISYEFDPNDYLKVREFLLKRRDPEFKKSQRDDLFSMETGMLEYKGRVNICLCGCINDFIDEIPVDAKRQEVIKDVCEIIDKSIHAGYKIFPINFVAYDRAFDTARFRDYYSQANERKVIEYFNRQLDKIEVDNITPEERKFMMGKICEMYANPLKNKIAVMGDIFNN